MEAATVQLKGDKAGLEASVRMKDTALGDISEMSLKVPCSSGVVEEPAAVYAAGLAQLAARRAKKGTKTGSSAPVAGESAEPRVLNPALERVTRIRLVSCVHFAVYCLFLKREFFALRNIHPDDWALHGRAYLELYAYCYACLACH